MYEGSVVKGDDFLLLSKWINQTLSFFCWSVGSDKLFVDLFINLISSIFFSCLCLTLRGVACPRPTSCTPLTPPRWRCGLMDCCHGRIVPGFYWSCRQWEGPIPWAEWTLGGRSTTSSLLLYSRSCSVYVNRIHSGNIIVSKQTQFNAGEMRSYLTLTCVEMRTFGN